MRDRANSILSFALTLSALGLCIAVVHREFFASPATRSPLAVGGSPRYVSNWTEALNVGILVGDSGARLKLVEFSDLECPVCRRFDGIVRSLQKRYPRDMAVVFVHFPLSQHRFARPSARAAECAEEAGRFREFTSLLYDKQDSLGLKSWTGYASEAGVIDTAAFGRCVVRTTAIPRIEAGLNLGRKFGVRGTPTVLLNGWQYSDPPEEEELRRAIDAVLAGRKPYISGS